MTIPLDEFMNDNDMDELRRYFAQIADSAQDLCNRLNAMDGVQLRITTHSMPLQMQGLIDGKYAYIRERHGYYYIELSDSNIPYKNSAIVFSKHGYDSIELMVFIVDVINEYRGGA